MRRLADTRSEEAWCVGKYKFFGEDKEKDIFLAKAILFDSLSWDIETYSGDNPDFPRTSTNNQLYSEFDFEAYRALGQSAVTRLLESQDYRDATDPPNPFQRAWRQIENNCK